MNGRTERSGAGLFEALVVVCLFAATCATFASMGSAPRSTPITPSPHHLITPITAAAAALPQVISTDYRKVNAANSSQSAFAITAGVNFYSTLSATYTVNSLGARNADRKRGLRMIFYGAGDDNDTADFKVWVLREVGPRGTGSPTSMIAQLYGFGTITLSTAVGDNTTEVLATERFADTISWTVATTGSTYHGIGSTVEGCYGAASAVYSPADNTPATLILPDLGNEGFYIVEFNKGADANCRPNALVADEG